MSQGLCSFLLGMRWQEGVSIDTRLLVGTRFPPTVTKAADALEWIINQQVGVLPHLDDFTSTPPLFG